MDYDKSVLSLKGNQNEKLGKLNGKDIIYTHTHLEERENVKICTYFMHLESVC